MTPPRPAANEVWIDGRPLAPVGMSDGPATAGYVGLASYNILGNDIGAQPAQILSTP